MAALVYFLSSFISGCGYLIRGGSPSLFNGPVPGAHWVGWGVSVFAFAAWILFMHFSPWLILIYAVGWLGLRFFGWQPYYSIGSSHGVRRTAVGYIDWILNTIWGKYQYVTVAGRTSVTNDTWWLVTREATGMFMRMMHVLPLFLGIGLFFDLSWHIVPAAVGYSAVLAFIAVLLYGIYNWFIPSRFHDGSNSVNLGEAGVGIALFVLPAAFTIAQSARALAGL